MTTARVLDTQRLSTLANAYEREIVRFLRDLVAIPAEGCHDDPVIQRIRQEMEKVGFDEIRVDGMGNILGRIGSGKTVVMMDAHSDTVGVGDLREWAWDPYQGKVEDGYVYGRGACDPHAGMASMVYAGKLIHELGMCGDCTLWVAGSAQKLYILKEGGIRPDCLLIAGPTSLRIYRGQRGRVELEDADPIDKMPCLVQKVEQPDHRLRQDSLPGKGSIAVTGIRSELGLCSVHPRRGGSAGESREGAEIQRYPVEKYYTTWVLDESHPLVQAAIATYEALFDLPPVIGRYTTSANVAGSMGLMGVPAIGFGPGDEEVAHGVGERVPIRHLIKAAQFYAAFPMMFVETVTRR